MNHSLKDVYDFEYGGISFMKSFSQVSLFMRIFKYDPSGIKKYFFDLLDPLLKGTKSFSYHRNCNEAKAFLNEGHELWCNPMDAELQSKDSFMDLYERALKDSAKIINHLDKIYKSGVILKDEIYSIIPNIASTHGQECGKTIEIKNAKNINGWRSEANGRTYEGKFER